MGAEVRAELRLAAWSLDEHDEPPRDLERDSSAQILFDQREREVHAGRDAGRGDHVLVPHEDGIGLDLHLWEELLELFAASPVGGRALAVQDASACEEERPRAHRRDAPRGLRSARDERDQAAIAEQGSDIERAGDDKRIDVIRHAAHRAIHVEGDRVGGLHRTAIGACDLRGVRWRSTLEALQVRVGSREDVERSDEIEHLQSVKRDEHNPPGRRAFTHETSVANAPMAERTKSTQILPSST